MTKHIDKIVPTSAIFLSFVFAFFAYHLANANALLPSQQKSLSDNYHLEIETVRKAKIFLIPGHDDEHVGAEYGDLKEADLNLDLAEQIMKKIPTDEFEIYITRDKKGYKEEFHNYFIENSEEIQNFVNLHKSETRKLIEEKTFEPNQKIKHNRASEDMALRLYGFNKWANENEIDLVLHIHFNDYPRKNMNSAGKYEGYSIYIPEAQLKNHKQSQKIAEIINEKMSGIYNPSNLKVEEETIIESQSLIAVGANNTLEVPSVLVEYSYIYEDFLQDAKNRAVTFDKMSDVTVKSILNYFNLASSSSATL